MFQIHLNKTEVTIAILVLFLVEIQVEERNASVPLMCLRKLTIFNQLLLQGLAYLIFGTKILKMKNRGKIPFTSDDLFILIKTI